MHVLVNWLVQGSIIAAAAALALRVLPVSRTQARYCLVWVATLLIVVIPVLPTISAAATSTPATNPINAVPDAALPLLTMPETWWTSTTFALILWLVWAIAYAARIAMDTFAIRRAKRNGGDCPEHVMTALESWSRLKTTGRPARVMLSHDVRAAAVLGCGSPIIAVSPALIRDLSPDDLDRILVHEWAHVQRYDDIARGVQALLHVVAGWHPAVHWLRRHIEIEREVACDEMAVAVTGSPKAYAACLTALAARFTLAAPALPALGAISPSGLERRVVRILAARRHESAGPRRGTSIAASTMMMALAVAIVNLQVVDSAGAAMRASKEIRPIARTTATPSPAPSMLRVAFAAPEVTPSRSPSDQALAEAKPDAAPIVDSVTEQAHGETAPLTMAAPAAELPAVAIPTTLSIAVRAPSLLAAVRENRSGTSRPADAPAASDNDNPSAPWAGAVNAGIAIGRGSQNAGVATGRVFSRFSKRVAGSF